MSPLEAFTALHVQCLAQQESEPSAETFRPQTTAVILMNSEKAFHGYPGYFPVIMALNFTIPLEFIL